MLRFERAAYAAMLFYANFLFRRCRAREPASFRDQSIAPRGMSIFSFSAMPRLMFCSSSQRCRSAAATRPAAHCRQRR